MTEFEYMAGDTAIALERADAVAGVAASLMCAADLDADPGEHFWASYFATCPQAYARMEHMDEHMQGRMLASVFDLLMIEDLDEQHSFLDFEIGNHDAYGARLHMYETLFAVLHGAVRAACGARWEDAWDDAWRCRGAELLAMIGTFERQR